MSNNVPLDRVLAAVRASTDRPIPLPRRSLEEISMETPMTAPSPAGLSPLLDQLDEARPLADQFSKALRDHADDCICDRWVTHHSQMLAVIAGRIITAEVEARVQAAANQRAAEAVHAAADWIWDEEPLLADASVELHRQADALTAALTPGADTAGATA